MAIIIYPPTIDWLWMKQRPQQLMKQFARLGHTVYYCNKTMVRKPVEKLEPNLHLVHHHDEWLSREWPAIRSQMNEQVIVWCSFPKLFRTLHQYRPDRIIYDCVDEFPAWLPYERGMVNAAHAVVCTSERLHRRLASQYPGKPLLLARNAYDPDMGLHLPDAKHQKPADLPAGSIVGYIGAWAPWVDALLVTELARQIKGLGKVAIIGPEFGRQFGRNSDTIQFLGLKPHGSLPAYLAHLSVCIIPFLIQPITLATNPVKAYEYLAAGKPVVSTDLPECRLLQPHVDVAKNRVEFFQMVKKRLQNPGDSASRTRFALNETWEHRARQIAAFISGLP
jgi:glycosyltransferase involved in cell wall biosynthesis